MKKYWIKDLNERQVIHAPTEEIAKKICNKFHKLGLQWNFGDSYLSETNWSGYEEETCYSPSDGEFCCLDYYTQKGYEILTIDQLMDFQDNEYPKVMEVSNNGTMWRQRVVFMDKNGKFLAWELVETIEEADGITDVSAWKFAREIQPTLEYNGFTPFEIDDTTLYSKDFPEIGYTLCTSDDDTFTIGKYDDGDILARFHIDNIESINSAFSRANEEISKFKSEIKKSVDMLVNGVNKGGIGDKGTEYIPKTLEVGKWYKYQGFDHKGNDTQIMFLFNGIKGNEGKMIGFDNNGEYCDNISIYDTIVETFQEASHQEVIEAFVCYMETFANKK